MFYLTAVCQQLTQANHASHRGAVFPKNTQQNWEHGFTTNRFCCCCSEHAKLGLFCFVLFFSAAADSSPPPKLFMLHLMKVYLEIISHSSWNETNAIHFSKKSAYQHKPEVTNAASEAHQLFTATPKLQSQKEL